MIVFQRLKILFLLTILLLLGTTSAFATEFAVGTCKPSLSSFSSISAAVSTVPPGSTVLVCPGTYAEQVTISQPLTLEGIAIGNSDQVIIAVPSTGLSPNAMGLGGTSVAAQVLVTAGPVNITNITVDGTGNTVDTFLTSLAGIFYDSGSSGVLNQVVARDQADLASPSVPGTGVGIWVQNGNTTSESVTIENCSVHDFNSMGIFVETNQSPSTLNATVRGNSVDATNATASVFGIAILSGGVITNNTITGPGAGSFNAQGLTGQNGSFTASINVITNWESAIVDFNAGTYTNNTIRETSVGFAFNTSGATVNSNTIAHVAISGIEFNCNTGTVRGNTIDDAGTGLNDVPGSQNSTNNFFNVVTIRNDGCSDASSGLSKGAAAHTPKRVPRT